MTIPVDLGELEAAARERGPAAYILTVNDRGTPHVVHAEVTITSEGLVVQVGERTALHARHRPNVSLLYPCRSAADYSLIVDAVASVVATPEGSRLLLMPTRAVQEQILHGMNLELSQECRPFRAHAGQAGYWTS